MTRRRTGYYGGTFDPVHRTHVAMARTAVSALRLDALYFVPNALPPHKAASRETTYEQRCEMIRLATASVSKLGISNIEAEPVIHYTADTVERLRAAAPDEVIYFIIGEDSLRAIDSWHEPHRIFKQVRLAVFPRGRATSSDALAALCRRTSARYGGRIDMIPMSGTDISSSGIRAARRRGASIDGMVVPAVKEYIERHGLYLKK
ncbi:MAG: nicotinate (nicotinamide) nucleotide adenylyltransferase [Eubacteriales bacterium]|nr:nicotinate (nicotinamide) nucleotide adenylyltransferase [Eubacteriales bacterium]